LNNPNLTTENSLVIKKVFSSPRETVFAAWTDPQHLKQWFAPSDEMTVPIAEVDLRVGGRYRIAMRSPEEDKGDYIVVGTYRETDSPRKLAFTWRWETNTEYKDETLVTVDFNEVEGGTEVVLTHEQFTDRKWRDEHNKGWTGCIDRLGKHLFR
jgi:uncharacterized protein YndB with AHSA1/START domain